VTVDNVRIIGARRAYEFAPDDIRLSSLTLPSVIDTIRHAFQFQTATIGTPAASFGPVPPTLPPGLVFTLGRVVDVSGSEIPVRALNFEPRRIVVDVVGFSSTIDVVYQKIRALLADLESGDGSPVLGEPIATLDQSVMTAHLAFSPDDVLPPSLRAVFETAMGIAPGGEPGVIVPTILVQKAFLDQEFPGGQISSPGVFQFALREGFHPDDRVYFSVAPLDSDSHIRYLAELEAAVTSARVRTESEETRSTL